MVSLSSYSFLSDPTTFTLFGDTSGGPPTTYIWTRNGQVITHNATYNIFIEVNGDVNVTSRFQNSSYRSTLTVTSGLTGVYQYSVTNRATPMMVTDLITIAPVISTPLLTARSVNISWTQPGFNLTVVGYTVTVTRVTGSGQVLCPSFVEEDQSTTTSPNVTTITFTGLQESSSYTIRVTVNFSSLPTPVEIENTSFTTLSSCECMH